MSAWRYARRTVFGGSMERNKPVFSQRLARLAGFTLAFAVGFALGTLRPSASEIVGHGVPASSNPGPSQDDRVPTSRTVGEESSKGAVELLAGLRVQVRALFSERDSLSEEAKRASVAYSLLRSRGATDDSSECKRLLFRKAGLEKQLEKLTVALKDALRVEVLLEEEIERTARDTQSERTLDTGIVERGRRILDRLTIAYPREEAPIPEYRWSGGPDRFMAPEGGSNATVVPDRGADDLLMRR